MKTQFRKKNLWNPLRVHAPLLFFGGIAGLFDHGISHNPGRLRVGPGKTQDRSGPLEPPKAGVATTASKATLHEAPTLEPATCPCATALFWRHCGSLRSWHQPQPPTKPAQDQKSPLRIVDPLVDPGHPA